MGAKTRELDVVQTSGPAVEALRELWAVQVNHALERIQFEARVDHRSYARRGEDQVATQHLGPAAAGMERKAARRAQERRQEATRAVPSPAEAPWPAPVQETAQGASERARAVLAPQTEQILPAAPEASVRPSAGVCGAGLEPATRIGRHNAEIQERNRAALEVARRVLEGLERAAALGRRWVSGLARGLGTQIAGEREERARQAEQAAERQALAQEAARRAEQERQERARAAERAQSGVTQAQRDAARQAGAWSRVEDAGRKAREADRGRQGPDHQQPGERQGPRLGR